MADIAQVEKILRNLKISVTLTDDGDFAINFKNIGLKLTNADVEEYLTAKTDVEYPLPTAIFIPSKFEQAVQTLQFEPFFDRLIHNLNGIELEDKTQTRRVAISPASTLYVLSQLDSEELPFGLQKVLRLWPKGLRQKANDDKPQPLPFRAILSPLLTIKVTTSSDDVLAQNCRRLQSLADASLFHITNGHGVGLRLLLGWEQRQYLRSAFLPDRDPAVQFPLRTYISELLSYYQLAFGTNNYFLIYISLYQILEYFFTSSSNKLLYQKMAEKLVEPRFSHKKPKELQQLARVIRLHDNKLNEKRMLSTVLEHYFDAEELRNWIADFDEHNEKYLTTAHNVFGKQMKVESSDDQIFTSIANRIYHIRNALVHQKEGEVFRFIPFSGQEEILYNEIPLILYLSEQIIIRTGKDLQ